MIPVFRPSVGQEELESIREALESGWLGLGPKTSEFEQKLGQYLGAPYVVATNSATAALHLALMVLNIGPGDEVISPSLTFVSTNHAILYTGGVPVFSDVYEDTLCIDVDDIRQKITDKTKAIMVVHYGGHPCDMDRIMELAREFGLFVIEDCAHGCGSEYKGKKVGDLGDIGCFSFHAVKNLATCDGGAITTRDPAVDNRLRKLRWMGITKDTWERSETGERYTWYYDVEELGFKYHMNDVTAAIASVQLGKLDNLNDRRREIVQTYHRAFADLEWLQRPVEKEWAKSAFHNYVVKVEKRDRFMKHLREAGVATSVHYIPNHHYAMYSQYRADVPVTDLVWKKLVTLPLFPDLSSAQIEIIIESIRSFKP